jgi:signal transduction histidine kinase/streptogramin lyase
LPQSELQSLAEGNDGTVWVGARNGLYNFKDGLARQPTNSFSLTQSPVGGLLVDREGIIWIGSVGEGLSRLSQRTLQHWSKTTGLAPPQISSVAEDRNGDLWIGTPYDGLWRFSAQRFSRLQDSVVGQNYQTVYSVVTTDDGSTWAAGEQFLLRFSPDQATQVYRQPPIRGEAIRALCADGTNLWLGTYYSTLIKVEGTNVMVVATNGSFGGGITSLVREGPESLWIGTSDGLYHWQRGEVKTWTTRDGLLTANVGALHRDADGTLWIGTVGGGLARLKNGHITNITTRQGLVDDVISQILADDLGHLWLGCNRGLMCLERRDLEDLSNGKTAFVHPIVLGANEGMIKEQCTGGHSPTAVKTKNGRLLFPTVGGLAEINPRLLHTFTTNLPRAIIEEVLVDDASQQFGAELTVPPGDHHVDVHFTAPSLRGGDWVRFRTRLEGLESDWVPVGTRRTATYAGLRPGRYVFHVTACDSKGTWNKDAASLAIIVKPWFWQSSWFAVSLAVTAMGCAVAWYRLRVEKLEDRRKAQEAFTRQLIGAQEAERARLARELHDDITQRLARLAIDAGRVERAGTPPQISDTMREVREGLVRLSEDVHALSYRLHPSLLEDLGLAEAIKAECERFSRQESIHAEVKLRDLPPVIPRDAALGLFRIAQEALRNVARHAQANTVDVTLRATDGGLQLAVRDNGVGFDPSRKREHLSLGLASMRERAGLLDGELDIESAAGHGTTIVAWVPL